MAKFKYAKGDRVVMNYFEAASQTFKAGAPVYLASGKLTAVASDGIVILGIADADATGVTNTVIPVTVAAMNTIFAATVTNAGASTTAAVTNQGVMYAVYVSGNDSYVDLGDATNHAFTVVGIVDPTSAGAGVAADGEVYVTVVPTVSQFVAGT